MFLPLSASFWSIVTNTPALQAFRSSQCLRFSCWLVSNRDRCIYWSAVITETAICHGLVLITPGGCRDNGGKGLRRRRCRQRRETTCLNRNWPTKWEPGTWAQLPKINCYRAVAKYAHCRNTGLSLIEILRPRWLTSPSSVFHNLSELTSETIRSCAAICYVLEKSLRGNYDLGSFSDTSSFREIGEIYWS